MIEEEPLMTYAQAAEWLGMSRRWLEDGVQAGRLPHARFGKNVRFSRAHLRTILLEGELSAKRTAAKKAKKAKSPSATSATATERRQGSIGRRRRS